MQAINLYSHFYTAQNLEEKVHESWIRMETDDPGMYIRLEEDEDLRKLCRILLDNGADPETLDGFYYGYRIPRISKEFDLLRISEDAVVDIELKHQSTGEAMRHQVFQNRRYLALLKRRIHCFTFVAETGQLYQLIGSSYKEIPCSVLRSVLKKQKGLCGLDLDALFDPSEYLISPFSQPQQFLDHAYFLTAQQEQIRKEILQEIKEGKHRFTIEGKTGTGKSLLLYDLVDAFAEEFQWQRPQVGILHCGVLSEGHTLLSRAGYHLIAMENLQEALEQDDIQALLVDEAEHMSRDGWNEILSLSIPVCCALEEASPAFQEEACMKQYLNDPGTCRHALSNRIRVNKELAEFTEKLFHLRTLSHACSSASVQIVQMPSRKDAEPLLDYWRQQGYVLLDPMREQQLSGKEYDTVLCILDEVYHYDGNGNLYGAKPEQTERLYRCMTRARKKITLIIINNTEVFSSLIQCMGEHSR